MSASLFIIMEDFSAQSQLAALTAATFNHVTVGLRLRLKSGWTVLLAGCRLLPLCKWNLRHKSILSDRLKRIWPLWLVVDHQKIVFTATLSATLTLTNAPLRSSQKRAEAGSGLDDRIISTPLRALLPGSHLTAATPESVRREGVLTDGENGETDQKVNKYLQKRLQS